jgi:hypothetical protein
MTLFLILDQITRRLADTASDNTLDSSALTIRASPIIAKPNAWMPPNDSSMQLIFFLFAAILATSPKAIRLGSALSASVNVRRFAETDGSETRGPGLPQPAKLGVRKTQNVAAMAELNVTRRIPASPEIAA